MDKFTLEIVTPFKTYALKQAEVLIFDSSNGQLSLYAHHTDLISDVAICIITIKGDNHLDEYAVGGGALYFNQKANSIKLIVNSIESKDEIDLERAKEAKVKAEKMIGEAKTAHESIEAERKLKRALNRIELKNRY